MTSKVENYIHISDFTDDGWHQPSQRASRPVGTSQQQPKPFNSVDD